MDEFTKNAIGLLNKISKDNKGTQMKKTPKEVTAYTLREIPVDVWNEFKSKCALEGIPMREKMVNLIEKYNEGK